LETEFKGKLDGSGLRVAIVAGRFNEFITSRLLGGALDELTKLGVKREDVTVAWTPGAFEMPLIAKTFAQTGKVDVVICLGAVIRGETDHYTHVAQGVARGIAGVSVEYGIPVMFGVLTTDSLEQAINRAGAKSGNKGAETARAAVETVHLVRQVRGDS